MGLRRRIERLESRVRPAKRYGLGYGWRNIRMIDLGVDEDGEPLNEAEAAKLAAAGAEQEEGDLLIIVELGETEEERWDTGD